VRLSYGRRSVDVEYIPIVLLHINSGVKGKIQNFLRFCVLSLTLWTVLSGRDSTLASGAWRERGTGYWHPSIPLVEGRRSLRGARA
jgi:hypothetical protein